MKIAFRLSLILNMALLAFFVFGWSIVKKPETRGPVQIPKQQSAPAASAPAPIIATPPKSPSFQWTQLESNDYRSYIKNLRAIGCPDGTLRAIVTSDLDGVYATKHDELEQQLTALQNASWSQRLTTYTNQQDLTAEMQELPGEERAEIDALLGLKPQPLQAVASAQSQHPRQQPISLPLVMQNIDLAQLEFNDQQKQTFNDVREQFLGEIGGPNQDPNDPTYLARWQKAQSNADNMLEAMLGSDAYTQIQITEYQKSLESNQK